MGAKRIVLLACVALAAVAMVAPASASAEAKWTHDFELLQKDAKVALSGRVGFVEAEKAGYDCEVEVSATLKGNSSTGTVDEFKNKLETCKGTGLLAGCEVVKETIKGLPWTMHVTTEADIVITNVEVGYQFNPTCPFGAAENKYAEVTAVPDNAGAIETLTLSGAGIFGQAVGKLTMLPKKTYGVEA